MTLSKKKKKEGWGEKGREAPKRCHVGKLPSKAEAVLGMVWAAPSKQCAAPSWCIYFSCSYEKPPSILARGLEGIWASWGDNC